MAIGPDSLRESARGDAADVGAALGRAPRAARPEPWLDELGRLDVFRLILATGIVALLIGVTLDAAVWEKWVVN
jgi:hypothetical protein